MAWESRIKSEPRRRVVVAALMLCLLAGSTAVAVIYSHARRVDPVLTLYDVFTARMPDGYYRVPPVSSQSQRLNVLHDTTGVRGAIQVLYYPGRKFAQPLEVYNLARQQTGWISGSVEGQSYHRGALQVLLFASQSEQEVEGRARTFSEVMAVATVDGMSYLAIYNKAPGPLQPEAKSRIRKMALSVVDTRYRAFDGREVALGELRVPVPEQVTAYAPRQPNPDHPPAVTLAPVAGERFYRLVLYTLPTDAVTAGGEQTLEQAMVRFMAGQMSKLEGTEQPAGSVRAVAMGGRTVYVGQLALGQTIPKRYHEWAFAVDERRLLFIGIIADKNTQGVAVDAAKRIVAGARIATTAPTPPPEQGR